MPHRLLFIARFFKTKFPWFLSRFTLSQLPNMGIHSRMVKFRLVKEMGVYFFPQMLLFPKMQDIFLL